MAITTDTIIVSDTHLGSPFARPKELLAVLKQATFKKLILLGDIFDDLNFRRLNGDAWELLSFIRLFSEQANNQVIWIRGNHDHLITEVMSHLVGVDVYEEYRWQQNGISYLAIHGDTFDAFLFKRPVFASIGDWIYKMISKLHLKNIHVIPYFDRLRTSWFKLSGKIAESAAAYAHERGAQVVFCGHTHVALKKDFEIEGTTIHYINTGCWLNGHRTLVTVDEHGAQIVQE